MYPIYNEALLENLPKGLYLGLMHGRDSEYDDMDDWGSNGPLLGPLKYVHTTYGTELKLKFEKGHEEHLKCYSKLLPDMFEYVYLSTTKTLDLIKCGGKFYGDWCVFYNSEGRDK